MTMAPGAQPVVFEDRLIGHGVMGMLDAPFFQLRVKGLLVDAVIDTHVMPVADRVLPQGIGRVPGNNAVGLLVGGQVRFPQAYLGVG